MKTNIIRQLGFITLSIFSLILFSVTANAQYRNSPNQCPSSQPRYNPSYNNSPYYDNSPYYNTGYNNGRYNNSVTQIALTNGYQLGFGAGSNDRAYGNSFDLRRSKTYRDGDSGYRNEYGSKGEYKDLFRQGFEVGYRDGYAGRQRRTLAGYNDYNYSNDPRFNPPPRRYNPNRRHNNRVYTYPY